MNINRWLGVVFIVGILILSAPLSATAGDSTLLAVTKKVLWEAAKIGIDEAGNRVVGPTAWRYLKRVVNPVYDELQRRYPRIKLKGTAEAKVAAQNAIAELEKDINLQKMLNDGFADLKEGQSAIILELNRMNKVFNSFDETLETIMDTEEKILDSLKKDRKQSPTTELKEYDILAEFEKQATENNTPPLIRAFFRMGLLRSLYIKDVLENGKAFTTYTYVISGELINDGTKVIFDSRPTKYYIYTSGSFKDFGFDDCRDVTESYEGADGKRYPVKLFENFPDDLTTIRDFGPRTFCRIRGVWKLIGSRK